MAAPAFADVKAGVEAWSAGQYGRAVSEWRGPAENGDADALFNLAQAYRLGRGVPADVERAKELYAEAAQKGHVKAADNYGLLLFQQGQQVDAMPLIRAAAERGDPRAQYVLGLAHFNADYAEKDWVRAYALLSLAQSAGLPQASKALGQMDQFIPVEDRQGAQSLAREIEAEAGNRRAAELAAVDLNTSRPITPRVAPSVASPVPTPRAPAPRLAAAAPPEPPVRAVNNQPAATGGKWKVQLGAFGVPSNADRLWSKLSRNPALSGTRKVLVPGGKVTRLQAAGFATRADAQAACAQLKAQGQGCMVTSG
ncbi:sporulation protein [Erythrobacter insulae]|uniref:Sporulation protein n=2 Tax=Erythrobacter insulae TaxID=2584124 RepID=A0A547PEU6_9SPHN|nr:sporulation protein [Erythrobacter insulae]